MVQQNIVSFILTQLRQGKTIEEINKFLIAAGYDKAEVESSVQYTINLQANPQLAEEQRIQQLTAYIQQQTKAGYDLQTISNFLISRGYPYYEVNSAVQQFVTPKKEEKLEHKLVIFALIAMFIMTSAVTIMYFKAYTLIGIGVPEKLLDVEAEKLTTIVQQGGELNFKVKLINFGYEKRFDVIMNYKVIDRETQETAIEKSETLALSTTLENIVKFDIPENMKAGKYVLRTDATYNDFTATSGFIFDVLPKELAQERIDEIRKTLPITQNITEIPELAQIPEAQPNAPTETAPTPIAPGSAEKPFYEGKTRQQAFEMVKSVSVREPQRAAEMCKTLRLKQHQEDCIITIAKFKKDAAYCQFLEQKSQDRCVFELVVETKDPATCLQIKDSGLKGTCELLTKAGKVQQLIAENNNQGAAEVFKGFDVQTMPLPST